MPASRGPSVHSYLTAYARLFIAKKCAFILPLVPRLPIKCRSGDFIVADIYQRLDRRYNAVTFEKILRTLPRTRQ